MPSSKTTLSKDAQKLLGMMRHFPIQMFGAFSAGANDGKGIQAFKIASVPGLSLTMGKRTRYIMPIKDPSGTGKKHLLFNAYFLPYTDNGMTSMMLGKEADIFITPPLSGCSVVVTEVEKEKGGMIEKEFKVYHLNAQSVEGVTSESGIKNFKETIRKRGREEIVFVIDRADYAQWDTDRPTTLIGVRHEDSWSFHYQIQSAEDDLYCHSSMSYEDKTAMINSDPKDMKRTHASDPVHEEDDSDEMLHHVYPLKPNP